MLLVTLGLDFLFWTIVGSTHASLLAVAFGVTLAISEFARRAYFLRGRPDMVWQFDLLRFGSLLTAFTLTAWLTKDATTERYVALFAGANAVAIIMQI